MSDARNYIVAGDGTIYDPAGQPIPPAVTRALKGRDAGTYTLDPSKGVTRTGNNATPPAGSTSNKPQAPAGKGPGETTNSPDDVFEVLNGTLVHGTVDNKTNTFTPDGKAVSNAAKIRLDGAPNGVYSADGTGWSTGTTDTKDLPPLAKASSKPQSAPNASATPSPTTGATTPAGAPAGATPPTSGSASDQLAAQVGAGSGSNQFLNDTGDQALGLEQFPTDPNGNPVFTPALWIKGYGPIASAAGDPTSGALGGGHPGGWGGNGPQQINGSPPQSLSDPGKLFYRQSDAWAIANHPELIPQIKAQLVKAGLLDPTKMAGGAVWSPSEAAAFSTVLSSANIHGVGWNDMLAWLADHPNTAAVQVKVDNPADIRSLARQVISPMIGHDLSDAEMQQFVQDYTKWQFNQGRAAQEVATNPTPPLETTNAETPQAFAEDYARGQFGSAVQGHSMLGYLNQLTGMMGPTTPTGG